MTSREYFAAHALQALITARAYDGYADKEARIAAQAYAYADAMLKAAKEKKDE